MAASSKSVATTGTAANDIPLPAAAASAVSAADLVPELAPSAAGALSPELTARIAKAASVKVSETHLAVGHRYKGKVRDLYDLGDKCLIVATDRQSAFDRSLAVVPLKGAVLNQVSLWWFKRTEHIVPNHIVRAVDPNAVLVKKCTVFPIEVVVRGFITGTTSTSLWTNYKAGAREYCGISFPEGLAKNDRLATPVVTPTTKEAEHDRPIAPVDIVSEGWMTQADWDVVAAKALQVFAEGQRVAAEHGLLLVDTKYEFGRDADGTICLVDEIHTPDSSRYWLASTYEARHAAGEEPENIDKEFLRLWFRARCDPYKDAVVPEAPEELVLELSRRYVLLYQMITGEEFDFDAATTQPPAERMAAAVARVATVHSSVVVSVAGSYKAGDEAVAAAKAHPAVAAGKAATEAYVCTTPVALAEAVAAVQLLAETVSVDTIFVRGKQEGQLGVERAAIVDALTSKGVAIDSIRLVE